MKHIFYSRMLNKTSKFSYWGGIVCLLLSFIFLSCSNENNYPTDYNDKKEVLTLKINAQLPIDESGNSNASVWNMSDKISIFDSYGKNNLFVTDIEEASVDATFSGEVVESDEYYAIYPYSINNKINNGNIIVSVPSVFNTSDNEIYLHGPLFSKFKSGEESVVFSRICPIVSFSLEGDNVADVKSISLSDKNGNSLSGIFYYNIESGNLTPSSSSSFNKVTIEGDFNQSKKYNVPFVFSNNTFGSGVTMLLTDNEGNKCTKDISFSSDGSYNLGIIKDIEFIPDEPVNPDPSDYYIEYVADSKIDLPSYTCEYDPDSKKGRIYFDTPDVPDALLMNNLYINRLIIPSNIETIGKSAFEKCMSLKDVCFNKDCSKLKEIKDKAFFECNNLDGVLNIPNSLKYIRSEALKGLTSVKEINIGLDSQLEFLGYKALGACHGVTKPIVFPKTVKSFGNNALEVGQKISNVHIELHSNVPPQIENKTFAGIKSITVPKGTYEIYRESLNGKSGYNVVKEGNYN